MPDQTPPPALLSPERLAEISVYIENWRSTKRSPDAEFAGSTPLYVELFADRAAFRAQVAQQLRALLEWPDPAQLHTDKWYSAAADYERRIHAAAKSLNITL